MLHVPACMSACMYLPAAAKSELAEVKQLYQAQVLEKGKLKQKVGKSRTSRFEVCSLLYAMIQWIAFRWMILLYLLFCVD